MNKEAAKQTVIFFGTMLIALGYLYGTIGLMVYISGWFVLLFIPAAVGMVMLTYSICLDEVKLKNKKLKKGAKNGRRKQQRRA
jgi:4-hydroxybenzoate polyprenyltransferase